MKTPGVVAFRKKWGSQLRDALRARKKTPEWLGAKVGYRLHSSMRQVVNGHQGVSQEVFNKILRAVPEMKKVPPPPMSVEKQGIGAPGPHKKHVHHFLGGTRKRSGCRTLKSKSKKGRSIMPKYQDTHTPALLAIVERISHSPLLPFCRERVEIRKRLQEGAEVKFYNFDFRRAGTNITLYVGQDFDGNVVLDEETGDEYARVTFRTEVNWPSNGGRDPGTTLAQLALYREVTELCADIHADFCGPRHEVFYPFRTKEKRDQQEQEAQAVKTEDTLRGVIKTSAPGLRVEGSITVVLKEEERVPSGKYTVSARGKGQNKSYSVVVQMDRASITRTA